MIDLIEFILTLLWFFCQFHILNNFRNYIQNTAWFSVWLKSHCQCLSHLAIITWMQLNHWACSNWNWVFSAATVESKTLRRLWSMCPTLWPPLSVAVVLHRRKKSSVFSSLPLDNGNCHHLVTAIGMVRPVS